MPRKKNIKTDITDIQEISAEERAALDAEIDANLPEENPEPLDSELPEEEQSQEQTEVFTESETPSEETDKTEDDKANETAQKQPSFTKVIRERLFHKFSGEEFSNINAKIVAELERQKLLATERSDIASQIKKSNEEINVLLKLKERGGEDRNFECEVRYYCDLGKKYVIHPEKGSILRCEDITLEEREQDLPFSENAKAEEEKTEDSVPLLDPDLNPETED